MYNVVSTLKSLVKFSLEGEFSMSEVKYSGFLVDTKDGTFVPVSHKEVDSLVGRLMQMCDLIGDVEQRKALKDTIKRITRDWIDDEYSSRGYDKWEGARVGSSFIDATDDGVIKTLEED